MSKYTDFYGVSSVGDYPINSYFEYAVTATGNPVGYDAATGLYSHPNGSFWLETGNTLPSSSNAATYPNATVTTAAGGTGLVNTTVQPRGQGLGPYYDSVGDRWYIAGNAFTTVAEYTFDNTTWTATGNVTTFPNGNFYAAVDSTRNLMVKVDGAGPDGIIINTLNTNTQLAQIADPGNTLSVEFAPNGNILAADASGIIREYDTSLSLITTYNISANSNAIRGITYSADTNEYFIMNNATIQRYDSSFVYQAVAETINGNGFGMTIGPNSNSYLGFNNNVEEWGIGIATAVLGDATASTGRAGNPNFIRLG